MSKKRNIDLGAPFKRMKLTELVEMYAKHINDDNQLFCNQIWNELNRRDNEGNCYGIQASKERNLPRR